MFRERTVFPEHTSKKTASFDEKVMSKDKYPNMLSKSNGGHCILSFKGHVNPKNAILGTS